MVHRAEGAGDIYVARGDPAAADFTQADLTLDGAAHDLDLSSILPESAAGGLVHLNVQIADNLVSQVLRMRRKGNTNWFARFGMRTQVTNVSVEQEGWIQLDDARVIEYLITAGTDTVIITVLGWTERASG